MSARALRLGPAWLLAVALLSAFVGLVAMSAAPANADQSSQRIRQYVGGRLDASSRSLSANHTCAIAGNGTMHCWGSNSWGQLGYGHVSNVGDVETPAEAGTVNLGPGRTATAVTALEGTTCAILDNGAVKCWGLNNYGQLGYGNTTNIGDNETPAAVGTVDLGAGRTAVAISGAGFHTCAILDNGTVKCWGIGASAQLGYGNTNTIGDNETPAAVGTVDLGAGRTAVSITAGTLHTCAILDNGSVRCWGHNTSGELGVTGVGPYLGDNETPGSVAPVDLGAGRTAVAIAAGDSNTCAILDNGSLKCWGANPAGMLGYGTPGSVTLPATVGPVDLGVGRTASAVAMGRELTCAVLDDGSLRCWGNTEWGKLGYGNTPITGGGYIGDNEAPGSVPPLDLGPGRKALTVTAGDAHACAMLDDGTVRCWGLDTTGQTGYALGVFELFNYPAFVIGDNETLGAMGPVDLGEGHGALETAAGGSHSCALFDTGAVRCWGNGADGRLGYANTDNIGDNENVGSAGTVNLSGHGALQVVAGTSHTCALLDDGTVRCWGNGANGRLGYGNTTTIGDNETPGPAGALNLGGTAIQLAAGGSHTCALLASGSVRCWGNGTDGRLGYANTTTIGDNEAPGSVGPVSLGRSAVSISAGGSHTCAVLDDHTVRCWGSGLNGRLGYAGTASVGDNEAPSAATVVSMGGSGSDIAVGGSHTCTSLVIGPVRCWGNATSGQLGYSATFDIGDNEAPSAAGPVNLGGGANSVSVAAGESHTCAVLANNSVRCWGLGSSGQLGLGSTNTIGDNETPNTVLTVDLGAARTALVVSAGGAHTCATLNEGTVRCWGLNTSGQLGYGNTTMIGDNETPGSAPGVDFEDDLPVAVDDSALLLEDASAAAINVLANDTDTDGGPKIVGSKTNGSHGTVAITGGGTGLTYTPAANYCGADSFTYTLNGGSTATVSITVTCVDDSPVAVNDSTTRAEDSPAGVVDVLGNDTDVDGGAKSIASKTDGSHGTVVLLGGGLGLTYQPVANYCGADSFTYTLNGGSSATVSITVTCVDDSPTAVNDSKTLNEDAGATAVDVLANDADADGGPKTISSASDPDHGTVALTGGSSGSHTGLTYAPDANYCGADSFTYTLNGGSTAMVSVTVTCVDDLPTAVNDSKTLNEDAGATSVDVLANDTDADAGPKTIVSKTDGAHGTVVITGGGTGLTYASTSNYCGADSFTYELNGGSKATVSITITCVDDPPSAVADSSGVSEDSNSTAINVLANDTDPDGGSAPLISAKTDGAHGTVAITGGGTGLTYTPAAGYCGADSFTYTLNGGSSATVSITVTCVDDSPTAVNDSKTLNEDAGATAVDVLANDTDADGGPKTVASKTDGAHGMVAITGGGSGLSYTLDANYCGPDSFTYTLNGGSTATVAVTVTCIDDAPLAVNDADTLAEDSPATTIDVLANDTDIDGGPKSIAGKTNSGHGAVALIGAGAGLTYQPAADYCGPDSFTYTLNGGSTATVSVTVTCVDEPAPPSQGGAGQGQGGSQTIINPPSSGPVVSVTPGVGVVSGRRHPRIAIKGSYAFFTLTCRLSEKDCQGTVTIAATVPSIALGPTMEKVILIKGKFRIAPSRSVLVRAKLTARGLEVLEAKRTLRGVATRMAIVDAVNGERGEIEVNLVRRPKASLLSGGSRRK